MFRACVPVVGRGTVHIPGGEESKTGPQERRQLGNLGVGQATNGNSVRTVLVHLCSRGHGIQYPRHMPRRAS